MQKNVSARDMSLSLGQNSSCINQIESRKALPSLQSLFYICEYFGITPRQFFDEEAACPALLAQLTADMKKLDPVSLEHIAAIVKELAAGKRGCGANDGRRYVDRISARSGPARALRKPPPAREDLARRAQPPGMDNMDQARSLPHRLKGMNGTDAAPGRGFWRGR